MPFSDTTLLIRHLPSCLSAEEKEHLLRHFGAERVKVMGIKGPMKHVAFATFSSSDDAQQGLRRLHQLEVLGCKLVAEFARSSNARNFPSSDPVPHQGKNAEVTKKAVVDDEQEETPTKQALPSDEIFKKWSLEYPRHPGLHYLYPPPTVSIVTNIANALAAHPKFYVQTLHLMNKMNLPAPFGHVTQQPPIPEGSEARILGHDAAQPQEMELSSEEESEMEDSDGEQKQHIEDTGKKRLKRESKLPRKRPKLVPIPRTYEEPANQGPSYSAKEVFEQPISIQHKKIQLHIPEAVPLATDLSANADGLQKDVQEEDRTSCTETSETVAGFGKLQPIEKPLPEEEMKESELPYTINPEAFLTRQQIKTGRISESEMKHFSVFKNYKPGEPTSRLYIKNLAKVTSEQDLLNIYGMFVNWSSEVEQNVFDIRLMREGRMKGQAFITFPSEEQAKQALSSTNGYVLHSKPMAVQYARSAKAKETLDTKGDK